MRPAAVLFLLVLPALAMAQAGGGAPVVRIVVDPSEGIVIGQPVRLRVEVMFPGEMPHPPLVKLGDAPGAQILRFETQATTIRDRLAGQDYVGQSFEFLVFPRRGGEIALPAPQVTLLDRQGAPAGSAAGDPSRIGVAVPAGLDASGPVLAADKVTVSQDWLPDPASARFRAGSAITRTIRRQADGVPALGMAEFRFAAPDGVRVYVDPPVIDDRTNRGTVDGVRTDKATYVFEPPGSYTLPELAQPWWDLGNKQVRSELLPGLTLAVFSAGTGSAGPEARSSLRRHPFAVATALALLLLALAALFRRRLKTDWDRLRQHRLSSEASARKTLLQAASSGEPAATYRALTAWLERLPEKNAERLRMDAVLGPHIDTLERALFGVGATWEPASGAALAKAVAAMRPVARTIRGEADLLPPLNPAFPPRADLRSPS